MLSLRLEADLEKEIEARAHARHTTKSEWVRLAILRMLEDEEDLALIRQAEADMRSSRSLAELRRDLGLDG